MDTLKAIIFTVLGIAIGWFIRSAIEAAIDRIYDWRNPASWAALGVLNVAVLICLWR